MKTKENKHGQKKEKHDANKSDNDGENSFLSSCILSIRKCILKYSKGDDMKLHFVFVFLLAAVTNCFFLMLWLCLRVYVVYASQWVAQAWTL